MQKTGEFLLCVNILSMADVLRSNLNRHYILTPLDPCFPFFPIVFSSLLPLTSF